MQTSPATPKYASKLIRTLAEQTVRVFQQFFGRFIDRIKDIQIEEDDVTLSFDFMVLLTSIDLKLAKKILK